MFNRTETSADNSTPEKAQEFSKSAYGHMHLVLTPENIKHLLSGGVLTFDAMYGEYTGTVQCTT